MVESMKFRNLFSHDPGPINDADIATVTRAIMPHLLDEHSLEFDARALLIMKLLLRISQEQAVNRPIATAPRDGTMIRLRMGAGPDVTVGWWDHARVDMPWAFIDRQTSAGSQFLNRAVAHLPTHWALMGQP